MLAPAKLSFSEMNESLCNGFCFIVRLFTLSCTTGSSRYSYFSRSASIWYGCDVALLPNPMSFAKNTFGTHTYVRDQLSFDDYSFQYFIDDFILHEYPKPPGMITASKLLIMQHLELRRFSQVFFLLIIAVLTSI